MACNVIFPSWFQMSTSHTPTRSPSSLMCHPCTMPCHGLMCTMAPEQTWAELVFHWHESQFKSPSSKKVSFFLFLLLNFWAFSIYLVYIFNALTENLILGGSPKSMACDVTNSSEANPIFSIQQCDVETLMHIHRKWTLQTFFVQQSNLWTEKYIQNLWYNLYFLMREKEKAPF